MPILLKAFVFLAAQCLLTVSAFSVVTSSNHALKLVRSRCSSYMLSTETAQNNNVLIANESGAENIVQSPVIQQTTPKKPSLGRKASDKFIAAMEAALVGDQTALAALLSDDCSWDNPLLSTKSQLLEGLQQFVSFFLDPALVVFSSRVIAETQIELSYQLSFWWPLPWRPRIIIPATAVVTFSNPFRSDKGSLFNGISSNDMHSGSGDGDTLYADSLRVTSVVESWSVTPRRILTSIVWPRGWDIWNLFNTPAPEYPPARVLAQAGKVSVESLPASLKAVTRWRGAAKYQGPPLQVAPGFSLFGKLKLSRPKREVFYTSLPLEVQTGKYVCSKTGEEMKQTTWFYHVPTMMQPQLLRSADMGSTRRPLAVMSHLPKSLRPAAGDLDLDDSSDSDSDVDLSQVDFEIGYDMKTFMQRTTGGALRGNNTVPLSDMQQFEQMQSVDFCYDVIPERTVVATIIKGDATASKISTAVKELKRAIKEGSLKVGGKRIRIYSASSEKALQQQHERNGDDVDLIDLTRTHRVEDDADAVESAFGLELYGVKACFNSNAEPSMAAYEMQYNRQITKVFIQVEIVE